MVFGLIIPPEMKFNAALTGGAAVVVGAALIGCAYEKPTQVSGSPVQPKTLDRPANEKCNSDSYQSSELRTWRCDELSHC